jgi:hypothetical protein
MLQQLIKIEKSVFLSLKGLKWTDFMNKLSLGAYKSCYHDMYKMFGISTPELKFVNSTIDRLKKDLPFDYMREMSGWRPNWNFS